MLFIQFDYSPTFKLLFDVVIKLFFFFQNEEQYFRQFISGFVAIWEQQLNLDFDNPMDWRKMKSNAGPHLSRLPDELIPAMEKFIIIARDKSDHDQLSDDMLQELTLLFKCLIIICRNFDNVKTVIKSTCFINYSIALSSKLIDSIFESPDTVNIKEITNFIKVSSNFLEAIFDPVLCWRHYLKDSMVDYNKLDFSITVPKLNVEIIPFIYDYFELRNYHKYTEISTSLMHLLGSVICGSQVSPVINCCPSHSNVILYIKISKLKAALHYGVGTNFGVSSGSLTKITKKKRSL